MKTEEYKKMYLLEDSHFWFVGKRLFIDSALYNYKKDINMVLDLGSGTGGTTKYLERYGSVKGLENNKHALKFSRARKINIKEGDINNISYANKSFNLITILDVLYHKNITNEKLVLSEARRLLKSGGYLLITDSAYNFLKSYHDSATQGNKRYTLKRMKKLVENSGFIVIKASYIFISIFPLVFIKRIIGKVTDNNTGSDVQSLPKFINYLLILMLGVEALLLRYFSFPFGSSILVLAKKT